MPGPQEGGAAARRPRRPRRGQGCRQHPAGQWRRRSRRPCVRPRQGRHPGLPRGHAGRPGVWEFGSEAPRSAGDSGPGQREAAGWAWPLPLRRAGRRGSVTPVSSLARPGCPLSRAAGLRAHALFTLSYGQAERWCGLGRCRLFSTVPTRLRRADVAPPAAPGGWTPAVLRGVVPLLATDQPDPGATRCPRAGERGRRSPRGRQVLQLGPPPGPPPAVSCRL